MKGSISEHGLIIDQYHDLKARCTCGQWELTGITRDDEPQADILARARRQHRLHVPPARQHPPTTKGDA
jgi:hypothetical protein